MIAASYGRETIVKLLCEAGSSACTKDSGEWSPLMVAAHRRHISTVGTFARDWQRQCSDDEWRRALALVSKDNPEGETAEIIRSILREMIGDPEPGHDGVVTRRLRRVIESDDGAVGE